jgi:cytochrome b561
MYRILGWINITLLVLILTQFLLNYTNRKFIKTDNKTFKKFQKIFKTIHKPLGLALAVLAPIHGYMALGGFRLHTGSLLYLSLIITATLGGSFYRLRKKVLFLWHKRIAGLTVLLLLIHIFFPDALSYILN